jgi:septal ring factor EnvC (AmiA/AmiB activator)
MKRAAATLLLALALPCSAAGQSAQRDLRDSQLRLDSIREERLRLQKEMQTLHSRVRDASREAANAARQRAATAAAVRELDLQTTLLGAQVAQTQMELESTKQRIDNRSAALNGRLRSIYKRGPLHTVRVLLGAEDFSDLISRYKYLHLITLYDRRVIEDVSRLRSRITLQEEQLEQALGQLEHLRIEKTDELAQLQRVEGRTKRTLAEVRQAESRTAARLDEAEKAEKGLTDVIARLERERLAEEQRRRAAGGAVAEGTISTRDLGSLTWPVDGTLIYRFGPVRKPSGVTIVNKGIGIAAAAGTPVKAVEGGMVSIARPLEGYGTTVMLDHGGGYYTLYMFLKSLAVREGQRVVAGQVVGAVGGEQTPEGAHLFFQVRAPAPGQVPAPVDPLTWLQSRAAAR